MDVVAEDELVESVERIAKSLESIDKKTAEIDTSDHFSGAYLDEIRDILDRRFGQIIEELKGIRKAVEMVGSD